MDGAVRTVYLLFFNLQILYIYMSSGNEEENKMKEIPKHVCIYVCVHRVNLESHL
jgi:hypothetical protein